MSKEHKRIRRGQVRGAITRNLHAKLKINNKKISQSESKDVAKTEEGKSLMR